MIIRPAQVTDAAEITALTNDIVANTTVTFTTILKTDSATATDIQARGAAYLVAEEDGRVVGFATYFPFRPGPGYKSTQEHSIVLAPSARGRGVGRALMDRLEEVARAHIVRTLIAGVSGENIQGIAFHAALGFTEVGRLPQVGHKFGRWLDLVLMQKHL